MFRIARLALLAGGLTLGACEQQTAGGTAPPAQGASASAETAGGATPQAGARTPHTTEFAAGENDGQPTISPEPVASEAAKGERGARAVLLSWVRRIEQREFDQAWDLMGEGAKNQLSKSQFNAMFHPLRDISVAVAEGRMEGAAGSSYYSVPTTISGTTHQGKPVTIKGEVVLRRVNDIPGATPEELAWHVEQVNLERA